MPGPKRFLAHPQRHASALNKRGVILAPATGDGICFVLSFVAYPKTTKRTASATIYATKPIYSKNKYLLAEFRPFNPLVVGSSPIGLGTIIST
jgi:hypothetical protein